jgi:hypothetical protein
MNERDRDPDPQPSGVLPSRRNHERTDARHVDPQDVLERLRVLEVHAWRDCAGDGSGNEHLGPAAEDFYEIFDVGAGADHIVAGDADGVAMAAIQGLADRLDEQDDRIERQDRRIQRQQDIIDEQRDDIETLREQLEALKAEFSRRRLDSDERA